MKSQSSNVKCQMFCAKRKRGFTLAELLIVLAIAVIMTGVLLSKQGSGGSRSDVDAAARKVAAQLRFLQNEALGAKQMGSPATAVCSYRLDIANDATTYSTSYYSDCLATVLVGTAQSFELSGKGTGSNVKAAPAGGASLYFTAPRGELSGGLTKQIVLMSKDGSASASICIYGSGNISEKKDASAC